MKYKTKPVVIEAIKYTGDNPHEIENFTDNKCVRTMGDDMIISTLEGEMRASVGDFIIKGLKGEFYSCKPEIFEVKYEPVKN